MISYIFRATETKLNSELNKIAEQKNKLKELGVEDNELVKKIENTVKELREKEKELVKMEEDYRNRINKMNRFVFFFLTFSHQK